jgi:pentatricopeptide repeat protein
MVTAHSRLGSFDRALAVFDKMKAAGIPQNAHSFSTLLACSSSSGSMGVVERALALINEHDVALDVELGNAMVTAHSRLGNFDGALAVFDKMKAAGIVPDGCSFTTLLACASNDSSNRSNNRSVVERALALIDQHRVPVSLELAGAMITAHSRLGDFDKALAVFDKMKAAGVAPDGCSFTTLLASASNDSSRSSVVERALNLTDQHDIALDVELGSAMVTAHSRLGNFDRALAVFDRMKAAGVVPDAFSFSTLLASASNDSSNGLGGRSVVERALALIDEHRVPLTVELGGAMVTAHSRLGDFDKALAVFDKMKAAGVAPNARSFNTLLACSSSDISNSTRSRSVVKHALALIDEHRVPLTVELGNAMIAAHSRLGDFDRALAVFDKMKAAGVAPNVRSFSTLLASSSSGSSVVEHVLALIDEHRLLLDAELGSAIIAAHSRMGDFDRAREVRDKMEAAGIQPETILFPRAAAAGSHKGGSGWQPPA